MIDKYLQAEAEHKGKEYIIIDPRFRAQIATLMDASYANKPIKNLIGTLDSHDAIQQHQGIIGLLKFISGYRNIPIQIDTNHNLIQRILYFASQEQYPQLQLQALRILTIFAQSTNQCKRVVEMGAIPLLIEILKSENAHIAGQVVVTLGNIVAASISYRNQFLQKGGAAILILYRKKIKDNNSIRNCCKTIINIMITNPQHPLEIISGLIIILCNALAEGNLIDRQVLTSCWSVISSYSHDIEQQKAIINSGSLPKLVDFLKDDFKSASVLNTKIRLVQNTSRNKDALIELASLQMLDFIQLLVKHPKITVRYSSYGILSNLADNLQFSESIMSNKMFLKLLLNTFELGNHNLRNKLMDVFLKLIQKIHSRQSFHLLKHKQIVEFLFALIKDWPESSQFLKKAIRYLCQLVILEDKYEQDRKTIILRLRRVKKHILRFINMQSQSSLNSWNIIQAFLDL